MKTFYLQGSGTLSDAIFAVYNESVYVVAEVGLTGCFDESMTIEEARNVWKNLKSNGWKQVSKGRRSAVEISMSING